MSNQGYVLSKTLALHTAAVLTANGDNLDVQGFAQAVVQITGIAGDTVTFEVTIDKTNWVAVQGMNETTGAVGSTATANGIYSIPVNGKVYFRARLTRVGGTVTIIAVAITAAPGLSLSDVDMGDIILGVVGIDQATANANEVVVKSITTSETHVGEVTGSTINVAVTPTVTVGAYSALDTIGGIQTIAGAARSAAKPTTLMSIIIKDLAMQSANFKIWFFNATPSTGTYTDNVALDIDDTDLGLCVGVVNCANGEWVNGLDNGVLFLGNIGLVMTPAATSLFAVVEIMDIETFAAVGDLTFIYGFYRE